MATILMQILAHAMLPLSAQLKDFWFRRLASIQEEKFISKLQQSITSMYDGPRKVLNAFKTLWHVAA